MTGNGNGKGTRPLVSIGMAVYNGEATLERALDRVVGQTYANLEIIISDDCSTDGTLATCERYAARDPRIRIIRNPKNIGVTRNFNQLARAATGKYFMWADQDDIRETTFVEKTCAALEADPEAVLCMSHTGVFMRHTPGEVRYLVTLHGVRNVSNRPLRYWKFLNYYSDTVLYGLIRTNVLQSTRIYGNDVGSANALLFELLLRGKFLEVPEVLYYYSAKGKKARPDVRREFERANPGRKVPRLYIPFLVLARNQMRDIREAKLGIVEKSVLASILAGHTAAVAGTKLVYRALAKPFGDLPEPFARLCDAVVEPKAHMVFLNGSESDAEVNPPYLALKGG